MPFKFKPAKPGETVNMIVRVPGWLKNQIYAQLEQQNLSMNDWMMHAIHQQLHHGDERPQSKKLADAAEVISDYLGGRETLSPCGRLYPCEDLVVRHIGAFTYCDTCHIRIG